MEEAAYENGWELSWLTTNLYVPNFDNCLFFPKLQQVYASAFQLGLANTCS
jgi:hypothetical protein